MYSASLNCERVLTAAGIEDLFPVRVDGIVAAKLGLTGKPDPAVLLETARRLQVPPDRCVVIEDAEAGVAAGRNGGFGFVIGIDRTGHHAALLGRAPTPWSPTSPMSRCGIDNNRYTNVMAAWVIAGVDRILQAEDDNVNN